MATDLQDKQVTPDADANDPYNREFAALTDPEHYHQEGTLGEYEDGSRNSSYNPGGTTSAESPSTLKDLENAPDKSKLDSTIQNEALDLAGATPGLYKEETVRFFRGRISKRKGITGGIMGLIITIGVFMALGTASGPFQFIHLAQLLHGAHFSQQENASDGRMGKLYRFLRSGGTVGETRLGYLGSKYHANILSQLSDIGITPEYTTGSIYDGFSIDTEHPNSPYKGMSPEEAAAAFEERTGIKPTLEGGKLRVDAGKFWSQRSSVRATLDELGTSKVTTAIRTRVLARFGLVPSKFHPLKAADTKVNNTATKVYDFYKKKWDARLKGTQGENPVTVDGKTATDGVDEHGNPIAASGDQQATAENAPKDPGTTKGVLEGLKNSKGLKITGGVAAAVGVSCALKAVNDHIGLVRYAQVIVPMTQFGMDFMSVGYQTMYGGSDTTNAELGYLRPKIDGATGAASVIADGGGTGGTDLDSGTKDLISNKPVTWLAWTKSLDGTGICSTAGAAIVGAISIGIGILSGGTLSTLAGFAAGAALTGPAINAAAKLLAGNAVDLVNASGTTAGSYADYGVRFGANASALAMGGSALTSAQTAEVDGQAQHDSKVAFESQSIGSRLFNPYQRQSLISKVLDTQSQNNSVHSVSNIASGFLHIDSSLLSLSASLFTNNASAATSTYQYPFPEIGFSSEDQSNPLVQDPFANSDAVSQILNDPTKADTYKKKAEKCFGVNLTQVTEDGHQLWDAIPDNAVNPYDSDNYNQSDCAAPGDNNEWLRIRFFIWDTGVMESFACDKLDDTQSCANSGFGGSSASITSPIANTGTYKNPLRDIKNIVPERIDGGVDYNGAAGPIYAIGNGKVVGVRNRSIESGWPGNPGSYILYQLTDGPATGKYVYMAEDCSPTVTAGQALTADTVICNYNYAGTAMETGWSDGNYNYATNDYSSHGGGSYASNSGQDFSKFLVTLGAPAGKIEGTKSTVPMPAGWPVWQ